MLTVAQTAQKPVTAQSIALQPGDVAGLLRCDTSGDVEAVLRYEKANEPTEYQQNATRVGTLEDASEPPRDTSRSTDGARPTATQCPERRRARLPAA